ncbi:MAG: BatD family protein, partial [Flavobacteriales bacterium]
MSTLKTYISYLTCLLFIGFSLKSEAQEVRVTVDKTEVVLGETLSVSYRIEGKADQYDPPVFEGFQTLGRPGITQGSSNFNGNVSRYIILNFSLKAQKIGVFQLPDIVLDGTMMPVNKVVLKVVKEKKQSSRSINEHVFIKTELSKAKMYAGETFLLTYKLYLDSEHSQVTGVEQQPDFKNFWSKEIEVKNQNFSQELINGKAYFVRTLFQVLLRAYDSGKIRIKPIVLTVRYPKVNSGRRNIFGQSIFSYTNERIESKDLTLSILDLPTAGRPKNFSGAVGRFKIDQNFSTKKAEVGETISFNQRISGTGNFDLFTLPKVKFPQDIDVYDPKSNHSFTSTARGTRGQKEHQYILIPRQPGTFKVGLDGFSYFDTKSKSYKTIGRQQVDIQVSGEASSGLNQTGNAVHSSEVQVLAQDIEYIKLETELEPKTEPWFSLGKSWIWLFLLALAAFGRWLGVWWTNKTVDQVSVRQRKAKQAAKKRLKAAEKALKSDQDAVYFQVLMESIFGYFKDRFTLEALELNQEHIVSLLESQKIDN